MELDKTTGQPVKADPKAWDNQPSENKTYTVNGQEITAEKLIENYNSLQWEFTKKSQKLSEYEKGNDWKDDELDKTKQIIKDMGFTTAEELTDLKKFKDDVLAKEATSVKNKEFTDFTGQFNTLSDSQKSILKDLKTVYPDKSYGDILKTTNFIDQSLLEKSKGTQVMWGWNIWLSKPKEVPKSISSTIAKKMNIKSSSDVTDIRSKFNL